MYKYKTQGTCSTWIEIEAEHGVIRSVHFEDGCEGNLAAISRLVRGMRVEDAIEILKGTPCGTNKTSCPDQLARALERMTAEA